MNTKPGMSGELQEVFDTLAKLVWQLRYDWVTFETLYGDEERVELLNKLAPAYFSMEQRRFGDQLKLSIARLFDPEISANNALKTNLTLYAVVDLMEKAGVELTFVNSIKADVDRLKVDLQQVITERHKRLAHLDRATALGNNALRSITRNEFTAALDKLEKIMDDVDAEMRGVETDYGEISVQAGADTTIFVRLLEAMSTLDEQEQRNRWEQYRSSKG